MDKKIEDIIIGFENCETFTVGHENIKWFNLEGITERYYIGNKSNDFNKLKECKFMELKINPEANSITNLGNYEDYVDQILDDLESPFDIITKYNNIVDIEFLFTDKTSEQVYVNWDGDSYTNKLQDCKVLNDGTLVITIGGM